MKEETVTAKDFLIWVSNKNPEDRFDPWDRSNCVGHRFLRESGFPVLHCLVYEWRDIDYQMHKLPEEVSSIIDWATDQVPCEYKGTMSFGTLQEYLRTLSDPN